MSKELTKQASAILYLGIRYEDLLTKRYKTHGKNNSDVTLGKLLLSVEHLIPDEQYRRLRNFNYIRNQFAHRSGFTTLKNLSETIKLINDIEDGFASMFEDYKPDHVCENDFQQPTSEEKIVYVEVPTVKTVYRPKLRIPPFYWFGIFIPMFILIWGLLDIYHGLKVGNTEGWTETSSSDHTHTTKPGWFKVVNDHYITTTTTLKDTYKIIIRGGKIALVGGALCVVYVVIIILIYNAVIKRRKQKKLLKKCASEQHNTPTDSSLLATLKK